MIVANSTPLINFATIHRLDIIEQLFGKIVIPKAVEMELVEKGERYPTAKELQDATFIEIMEIQNITLYNLLKLNLDEGEAESITLALEQKAELLLLDELAGRAIAQFHNIPFIGSIGCLVKAKSIGIIPKIKPLLDAMCTEARFWIDNDLYQSILNDNNEKG
ncbi:MAG: DUF3368 domain-containing protein [bacterium]